LERVDQDVVDLDLEARLVARLLRRRHSDAPHLDLVPEPAVERLTDEDLRRRVERRVVRREQLPAQAAAEVGQVDALAWSSEQDLPDHLVDVLGVRRLCGLARRRVDPEREGIVVARHRYCPVPCGCATTTWPGPCTAWSAAWQNPTLSSVSVGSPTVLLRSAVTAHCTVVHGW